MLGRSRSQIQLHELDGLYSKQATQPGGALGGLRWRLRVSQAVTDFACTCCKMVVVG